MSGKWVQSNLFHIDFVRWFIFHFQDTLFCAIYSLIVILLNLKNLYHIIYIQRSSEKLWRVFYLKHFCILGFAQKETISLIHDTLCAWCYRTRNEKIFLRVQEQKIFQVQILFSFNSPCTSSQYRFFSSTAFKQTRDCIQKCV